MLQNTIDVDEIDTSTFAIAPEFIKLHTKSLIKTIVQRFKNIGILHASKNIPSIKHHSAKERKHIYKAAKVT